MPHSIQPKVASVEHPLTPPEAMDRWQRAFLRLFSPGPGAVRLAYLLAVGLAVLVILFFLASARTRVGYPYDINDTGMLAPVQHIVAGLPLYGPPNIHFTPFLYTPLFYYAAAAMSHLTGVNYAALRSVSALSSLGCFAWVYALVFKEGRRHGAALIAAGLFASCYALVLEWFDIGRVDMLYLFFLLAALYATRWWHPTIAAVLWVCAFQTKQGVLPIAVLALAHDWPRPRRVVLGLLSFAALLLGSIAMLTRATHGWYRYYVFDLISGLGYDRHYAGRYVTVDLLAAFGIALLIVLAAFLWTPPRLRNPKTSFYALTFVGMVVYTGLVRAHRGAAENALMPAYLWICLLTGLALVRVQNRLSARSDRTALTAQFVLMVAICVQLGQHLYSPREFRPFSYVKAERDQFITLLRSIPGDVLILSHPEYGVMAGKTEYAHGDAIGSIVDMTKDPRGDALKAQYDTLIHQQRLTAVALDRPAEIILGYPRTWMPSDFLKYYPVVAHLAISPEPALGSQPDLLYFTCKNIELARKIDPGAVVSGCDATQPGAEVRP